MLNNTFAGHRPKIIFVFLRINCFIWDNNFLTPKEKRYR